MTDDSEPPEHLPKTKLALRVLENMTRREIEAANRRFEKTLDALGPDHVTHNPETGEITYNPDTRAMKLADTEYAQSREGVRALTNAALEHISPTAQHPESEPPTGNIRSTHRLASAQSRDGGPHR